MPANQLKVAKNITSQNTVCFFETIALAVSGVTREMSVSYPEHKSLHFIASLPVLLINLVGATALFCLNQQKMLDQNLIKIGIDSTSFIFSDFCASNVPHPQFEFKLLKTELNPASLKHCLQGFNVKTVSLISIISKQIQTVLF